MHDIVPTNRLARGEKVRRDRIGVLFFRHALFLVIVRILTELLIPASNEVPFLLEHGNILSHGNRLGKPIWYRFLGAGNILSVVLMRW